MSKSNVDRAIAIDTSAAALNTLVNAVESDAPPAVISAALAAELAADAAVDAPAENDTQTDADILAESERPYASIHALIDALDNEVANAVNAAAFEADAEEMAILTGLRAMPQNAVIVTAIAAQEQKIEAARRDVGKSVLRAILADIGPRLTRYTRNERPPVESKPARTPAGRSTQTGSERIVLSADGIEYARVVKSAQNFNHDAADPCNARNCKLCDIADQAETVKSYGAYKMMLSKTVQQMTSEDIDSRMGCMYNVASMGLLAHSDNALNATVYVRNATV